MRTLLLDISRCAGRFAFTDGDDEMCPERETCQRYLAFSKWDKLANIEDYRRISVNMGLKDCKVKIEFVEVVSD